MSGIDELIKELIEEPTESSGAVPSTDFAEELTVELFEEFAAEDVPEDYDWCGVSDGY